MDLLKAISTLKNLNNFISLTHDCANKDELSQIPLNMSTALALKKMQSFEFEYFSRCQESGLAFMILDHILKLPPSKTWVLLGKELIPVLLYWLEGLRKYLVNHSQHWWIFLKSLLKFIDDLRQKDISLNTALVEYLAEPLLGLATSKKLDVEQRWAVLRCLNHCSAGCSRATRQVLAVKFSDYFTKIAHNMASCGHFPTQLCSCELLLRWLVARRDKAVREHAARRWLPATLWGPTPVHIFVHSAFKDFFKDARDFLNAHNETSDSVTSVLCRKMTIGTLNIVTGTEQFETWLDVNCGHGSVTVLLDPRLLQPLTPGPLTHDTLTVSADSALAVELYRESSELTISVATSCAPGAVSAALRQAVAGLCGLRVRVSSRCDAPRLDRALRRAFADKYRCLLDVDKGTEVISPTPQDFPATSRGFSASEDDTRFSNSFGITKTVARRRKRSGYVSRSRCVSGWKSPSTASTTSLAQLHEKLASLPRLRYDKEPVGVCAAPELSVVAELSEPEDSATSQRRRRFGVSERRRGKARTSPSDQEEPKQSRVRYISPVDSGQDNTSCLYVATFGSIDNSVINGSAEKVKGGDILDLLAKEALAKESVSKPLVVTDSGINTAEEVRTVEGDTGNGEALPVHCSVVVKKLPLSEIASKCTIVSKSTSDESNTETVATVAAVKPGRQHRSEMSDESCPDVITETPQNFVSVRRKNVKKNVRRNSDAEKDSAFDVQDIEEFFSQHFRENNNGDLMISPTLARKINESSSETSESFDQYLLYEANELGKPEHEFDVNPADITDCLSDMIDNVCAQIDKCNEFMERQETVLDTLEEVADSKEDLVKRMPAKTTKGTPKIKLSSKATVVKKEPKKKAAKKGKLQLEPLAKDSEVKEVRNDQETIDVIQEDPNNQDTVETIPISCNKQKTEEGILKEGNKQKTADAIPYDRSKENIGTEKKSDSETPLLKRRKRKLYSPCDAPVNTVDAENIITYKDFMEADEDDAIPLAELKTNSNLNTPKQKSLGRTTPKSAATPYKDIEIERQKNTKPTRNRKSKVTTPVLSPKTQKKNSLFDKLKDDIENKDLRIVDKKSSNLDIAVYNYTSDSEDEDFKKKKIVDLRRSGTTLCSTDSVSTKGRVLSKVNYTESSADETKANKKTGKKGAKRQPLKRKRKKAVEIKKELGDERMRHASTKELDTSINKEHAPKDHAQVHNEVEPVISCRQEMEMMEEVALEEYAKDVQEKDEESNQKKVEVMAKTVSNQDADVPAKKLNKKISELSLKKNTKDTKRQFAKLTEERSDESSLPALIIEKTAPRLEDDVRSTTSSNLIKKCNRLIEEGEEFFDDTLATQNMLSDSDKRCYSPALQDEIEIELCDKLDVSEHRETRKGKKKTKNVVTKAAEVTTDNKRCYSSAFQDDIEIEHCDKLNISEHRETRKGKKKSKNLVTKAPEVTTDNYTPDFSEPKVTMPKKGKSLLKTSAMVTIDIVDSDSTPGIFEDTDTALVPEKRRNKSAVETKVSVSSNSASVSIATYGTSPIRCGSGISPPNPDELTDKIEPRNMELEELSPSMHSYFLQLRTVITEAPRESSILKKKASEIEEVNAPPLSSPVVRLSRISDDDFRKWLPSPKSSFTEDQPETIVEADIKPSITKISKGKHPKVTDEQQSKINSKNTAKAKAVGAQKAAEKPSMKRDKTQKDVKPEIEEKRISNISPVHLSDDEDGEEVIVTPEEKTNFLKKITEIFSQTKTNQSRLRTRSGSNFTNEHLEVVKQSSVTSKASSGRSQSRKRSLSPQISPPKRRKVQTEPVSTMASSMSAASVREWFTRDTGTTTKRTVEDTHCACRDNIENVMEKLDTTLIEIHQGTSRKFVNMFVDIQSLLNELEARQAAQAAASARHTLSEALHLIGGVMEKQQELLRNSYNELVAEFKEKTRRMAAEVIREDTRQKRAMVTILREDVQAVLDHLADKRRTQ